ncbi:hypothetical protein [Mycobacterium sp.]|uniref:hypothetical protein n=1 Tax=Mycobacterium sp. TaxID=1785 RepID=UPI002D8E2178|nr:hypothetical protein [Mycobacterium sp.]
MTKRLAGILAAISATWLTLALVTPMPMSSAAVDTGDASIPVDPVTTLEMHVTANCIAAEGNCLWNTAANLRTPEGVTGFPGDLYARQTTTVRTMDRSVWVESDFDAPNTRLFKAMTSVELSTVYFGGGPPEKFTLRGNTWPTDWRTGGRRTDVPLIVCSHIQVVYAGVNVTSPDACAQASFS